MPPLPEAKRQPAPNPSEPLPFKEEEAELDDVMMAMDVVDTLRHERMLITRDVNSVARQENLVDRLRGIYRGQGIEVPDEILLDGVKALEEERFRYQPPKDGLGTRLALLYVNRGKWLPLVYTVLGVIGLGWAVNYYGFTRPAQVESARVERLAESLPAQLEDLRETGLDLAATVDARAAVETAYANGTGALAVGDVERAEEAAETLTGINSELAVSYDLQVVNRAGEASGANRFELDRNGRRVSNQESYYLIVDAVGADGRPVEVSVTSDETGETRRTSTWGQRVTEAAHSRAVADKRADGIVDARDLGSKPLGELSVDYTTGDYAGEVLQGRILEW